jgi:CRISPR-associated protein Cas1
MESVDTMDGTYQHRRVDKEEGQVPQDREDDTVIHARSVMLSASETRLIARIDLLELAGNEAVPVEYKRGRVPDIPGNVWESDLIQLCAQVLILRENNFDCQAGVVYYVESKTRVDVDITPKLVARTLELRDKMIEVAKSGSIPDPFEDSPKCPRCSLAGICLPDEINMLNARKPKEDTRRLVPGRQDTMPVYVQAQGAIISKKGDELVFKQSGQVLDSARLLDVSQVCVFGNVQISTQVTRELLAREIPLCYYTYGGWFSGYTTGLSHKNIELRIKQFDVAGDKNESMKLARSFVEGKIRNCRTLLRRNHPEPPQPALTELSRLLKQAGKTREPDSLLGVEGAAAKIYFANLPAMLKPKTEDNIAAFSFESRNRRPPTDPINAMLSFVYALLVKDVTVTLLTVGFDPYLGFYHRPRYGRPALALDMAEEFRPLIGDSIVLTLVNKGEVDAKDFLQRAGAIALTDRGRRQVLSAYERRMDTLVTHPLFGYSISYRRILEVQARLLGRYLSGEINSYPPFVTR